MLEKITAFLMAIYLFIAGIPYGNQPNKVEFSYEISNTTAVYESGDDFTVRINVKNVGRPFMGKNPIRINVKYVQSIDGKDYYIELWPYTNAEMAVPSIIKHGYEGYDLSRAYIDDDTMSGEYDMVVEYAGCTQVFEDVITVK